MADEKAKVPTMTLADLAGVDISTVEAVRFENIPEMLAKFVCGKPSIEALDYGENMKGPAAIYSMKVAECISTVDTSLKKEDMVGKEQRVTFMLRNAEDIGRFRAFLEDAGCVIPAGTSLPDLIAATEGMEYMAKAVHTKNKNDPDKPYCNIRPVKQAAQAA